MFDWQTVLVTALITALGTVLVTIIGHRLTIRRDKADERERSARYLAMRVVCVLDPFVSGCVEVAYDTGIPDEHGCMQPESATPNVTLPEDVDWQAVDPVLMYRILALPNQIIIADQAIAQVYDYVSGPPDYSEYFEKRVIKYGELGIITLNLADDLRNRYGIPEIDYQFSDPRETLQLKIEKAREQERERDVCQAEQTRRMMVRYEERHAATAQEN